MATDIHLKIEGIKGESKDAKHKDEMEITDWSWSFVQPSTMGSGGGGGAGKVTMEAIEFGKNMDLATPTLAIKCCTGEHIPTAVMTQRKAGGKNQLEYLRVEMKTVMVSGISHSSSGEVPTEKLKLSFASFKLYYAEQDDKGAKKQELDVSYSLKENKIL